MKEFYEKLLATADSTGLKVLTDEHCCQLLAWLYAYGGANEAVILNMKLNADIRAAQRRLNINGGERPNPELFPMLKKYLDEVEPLMNPFRLKNGEQFVHPQWAFDICTRYNLDRSCIR